MKIATLMGGEKVPLSIVDPTIRHLERMAKDKGIMPLYELREVCRDPEHKPCGNTGDIMRWYGLLVDWDSGKGRAVVHADIRAVILAAVQGQNLLDLEIVRNVVVKVEEAGE